MILIDDGRVAVTYEDRGGTFRALDHVPDTLRAPFVAACEVTRLSADVAKLHAAAGVLSRPHLRLIVRHLLELGYRVAYMDRLEGHTVPLAKQIVGGDFDGWWRLDLAAVRLAPRA